MSSIFWALAIIAIGLVRGSSCFMGDFTILNIFFDGLGTFWVVKGVLALMQARSQE